MKVLQSKNFFMRVRNGLRGRYGMFLEERAKKELQSHALLWNALAAYREKSPSTGCSFSDFLILYTYVRQHKPKEILECGTGVSTIILAHALLENEKETGIAGRVTSMEENEGYYKSAVPLLPPHLTRYIDMVLSPTVEDVYGVFRGIRYADIPDRPYDFVFVDGPDTCGQTKVQHTSDLDFIKIVSQSDMPVCGVVDQRIGTCLVYHALFGEKFRYDYVRKMGFVGPCTRHDLDSMKKIIVRPVRKHFFKRTSLTHSLRTNYW